MKQRALAAVPAVFVLLWSTGFVVARYATRDAGPLTFLAVRMLLAAGILGLLAQLSGAPKPTADVAWWAALAGVFLHVVYLGGVFLAIDHGLPSGLSALISGLHPALTAVAAYVLLGERLNRRQVMGVALGLGGVTLVVIERLSVGVGEVTTFAMVAMIASVLGMSSGTLLQRGKASAMPLMWGTAIHFASAAGVLLVLSVVFEGFEFEVTRQSVLALAWGVGVLSIAAILLMVWLLANHSASSVMSLFFVTPALSTIEGAVLFDERLGALAVIGLVVAVAGVALTTRQPAAPTVELGTPSRTTYG